MFYLFTAGSDVDRIWRSGIIMQKSRKKVFASLDTITLGPLPSSDTEWRGAPAAYTRQRHLLFAAFSFCGIEPNFI